jgi:hypothetical protein
VIHDIGKWLFAGITALTVLGCDVEEGETVGPRGGVVISDDGLFSLEIPAGALEQDVDITIDRVPCQRADVLGACYEVGPVGLPLLLPAEVIYEVDAQMLRTFAPDELAVVVERDDDWSYLSDRMVDQQDITVSASAVYLSSFALVSMP